MSSVVVSPTPLVTLVRYLTSPSYPQAPAAAFVAAVMVGHRPRVQARPWARGAPRSPPSLSARSLAKRSPAPALARVSAAAKAAIVVAPGHHSSSRSHRWTHRVTAIPTGSAPLAPIVGTANAAMPGLAPALTADVANLIRP